MYLNIYQTLSSLFKFTEKNVYLAEVKRDKMKNLMTA